MKAGLPRLKWHMLRRRETDPAHLRENLDAGLRAGAALEVELHLPVMVRAPRHGRHDLVEEKRRAVERRAVHATLAKPADVIGRSFGDRAGAGRLAVERQIV